MTQPTSDKTDIQLDGEPLPMVNDSPRKVLSVDVSLDTKNNSEPFLSNTKKDDFLSVDEFDKKTEDLTNNPTDTPPTTKKPSMIDIDMADDTENKTATADEEVVEVIVLPKPRTVDYRQTHQQIPNTDEQTANESFDGLVVGGGQHHHGRHHGVSVFHPMSPISANMNTKSKSFGQYTQNATPKLIEQPVVRVFAFLVISLVLGVWIMQNSINAYFAQTYHRPSPVASWENGLWRLGSRIHGALLAGHHHVSERIDHANKNVMNNYNDKYAYTQEYKAEIEQKAKLERERLAQENAQKREQEIADQKQAELLSSLTLNNTHKVFFAGDSLMQGVAPHIQKHLQGFGIQSINLSKQSTGLAYPKFFDWQTTIKTAIGQDKSIKVLVMMVGPNDPWDMPVKGGKYLKFQSSEWDEEYQSRIADIITFAKENNVGVIWVTPPNMKKEKLNEQMIYLNAVIIKELERHNIQVIDSRTVMGSENNIYNDYLVQDGKQVKMRSGDGIHFSPDGQRHLAKLIQSYLIIE